MVSVELMKRSGDGVERASPVALYNIYWRLPGFRSLRTRVVNRQRSVSVCERELRIDCADLTQPVQIEAHHLAVLAGVGSLRDFLMCVSCVR